MLDKKLAEAFAAKHLAEVPAFGLTYIENVRKNIEKISENIDHNSEILEIALLLYNTGLQQAVKYRQDALQTSLTLVKQFLSSNNCHPRQSEQILHCIREHPLTGTPRTNEAKLLHDADLLERIGAFGIMNTCYLAGLMHKPAKQLLSELRHIANLLPVSFYTQKGKELANQRIEYFSKFLSQLEAELY